MTIEGQFTKEGRRHAKQKPKLNLHRKGRRDKSPMYRDAMHQRRYESS